MPIPDGAFVRVIVDRGIAQFGDSRDEGLTYRLPDGIRANPGDRVEVPLGKTGKTVGATVTATGDGSLAAGMRQIKSITTYLGPALHPRLLDLARWMSSYYVCPLGMVIASMLPAAVKKRTGERTVLRVSWGTKASTADEPAIAATLTRATKKAWAALATLPRESLPMLAPQLLEQTGIASLKTLERLAALDLLRLEETSHVRATAMPGFAATPSPAAAPTPTPDQQRIIDAIAPTIATFHVDLLRGITGSGKTEVYLRLIAKVLEQNKGAIVLVPEIALTPQTSQRFVSRFGATRVAVLHSGLTASQRHREWERVRKGEATVVVGARSAIFAPVHNLSLIVVDEEHDGSYKQDQLPRYNARDVAIKLAHSCNACIVLGSATPSLESYSHTTSHDGKPPRYTLWELTQRAGGGRLPPTRIVDMREERKLRASQPLFNPREQHLLGPTLEAELERTLQAGNQAMLLLNRRGVAYYLSCSTPACGFVVMCEDCDSALVMHRDVLSPAGNVVKCHHCQLEQVVPKVCPTCGKPLASIAGGTQRLTEEVERKFAALGIRAGTTLLRVDSDTMHSAREYFDTLGKFASGEARVLVGTQMIAKGLDFPGVTLVGIVDADTALNIPDFRASERTFQLVSQAAGRAGRASDTGRVIIQSYCPHVSAIRFAASHDYTGFATEELATRKNVGLPPFTRMARIVCRDEQSSKAKQHAGIVAESLRTHAQQLSPTGIIITGPAPCALARIAKHFRFAIDINAANASLLRDVLTSVRREGLLKSDSTTAVDVDPVSLM
ncbi:primosomal protein N' [Phycisphaerae bacterium]|nr:primosomal protein N' [Phycisphaerae bacterium]